MGADDDKEKAVKTMRLAVALLTSSMALSMTGCVGPGAAQGTELMDVESRLRRMEDLAALEATAACYGQAQDAISLNWRTPEVGTARARELLATCWASDIRVRVYTLGGREPAFDISGRDTWVGAVSQFFEQNKFNNTHHSVTNIRPELVAEGKARITSYATIPHVFRVSGPQTPESQGVAVEWQLVRYQDEAERDAEGVWRIRDRRIYLEDIMRTNGFFPGGSGQATSP